MNTLSLHQFEGVAFDAEGTLFDTFPLHHAARIRAFSEHGFGAITVEQHAQGATFGSTTYDILGGLLHAYGGLKTSTDFEQDPIVQTVVASRNHYFDELVRDFGYEEVEGATDFFKVVAGHFIGKTALVTAAPRANVATGIANYMLGDHLPDELVITQETIAELDLQPKPAPDPYALARTRMNISNMLVFEDTAPGVAAAKQAGATVVAVCADAPSYAQLADPNLPHKADVLLRNYKEARALFAI